MASTLGEATGFAVPALVGLTAWDVGLAAWSFYVAMVAAGAVEGLSLGFGQSAALKTAFPNVEGRWIRRTSAAAALSWAIGMLPSTLIEGGVPVWIALALFVPLGPVLLCSIGFAQWTVLREYVIGGRSWIAVNGVAWLIALPPTFIVPFLVPPEASAVVQTVGWVAAGLIMAATVAAVTGLWLRHLLVRGALLADTNDATA